jgi:uncharacterized membrane protein YwzB
MWKTRGGARDKRRLNVLLAIAIAAIALGFYVSAFFLSFE